MTTQAPDHQHHDDGGGVELRHHFDDDLDEIKRGLVEMTALVVENTRRAGGAAINNDLGAISVVEEADEPINMLYRQLETNVFQILARQQPVATDLRFLVATSRMLYELERSGDIAVNIVKCMARVDGFPSVPPIQALMARLLDESTSLLELAAGALAELDADAGASLDEADDVVDDLTNDFFNAITLHKDELGLDASVQLNRIGRFLERIADHAVNLGDGVVFIVTGSFPEDQHEKHVG